MKTERRKRLIEVAFPLEEVSAHSRREKNVRHGHISTLHIWWARRPLAACRAFIYASLVDDPDDDREREELLKEVADLASWDAVRKPETVVRTRDQGGSGLTGAVLLERARRRILDSNGGNPPRLLDPFAGGGAIPLEALRLGCEVEASDLNPVTVLILKGTVEYPQKYGRPLAEQVQQFAASKRDSIAGVDGDVPSYIVGAAKHLQSTFAEADLVAAYRKNPLATDVRYWGNWMLEQARKVLAEFYPPDPDGSVPVAYLWSRTVPCPSCKAEMPLIRQYWLARKEKKKVALEPVIDRANNRVDFRVVEGVNVVGDPGEATTSGGDTVCLLCRQVVKAEYVRQAGRDGKMGAVLTAVIRDAGEGRGKGYREDHGADGEAFACAVAALRQRDSSLYGDLPLIPDEPIARETLGLRIDAFGLDHWSKLFNERQLLALTEFVQIVRSAHAAMLGAGLDSDYARAVALYLGLAVDRLADYNSTITRWASHGEYVGNTFTRQALPMVWDYCEVNPHSGQTGGFDGAIDWIAMTILGVERGGRAVIAQRDARTPPNGVVTAVVTDPPYYDAIDYAGLSDFFYVWLKRSVGHLYPDLLSLPLTPKREQIIKASEGRDDDARRHYVEGMAVAFGAMASSLEVHGTVSVVFAHTDPDAWATLIDGLLDAGLVPDASWPIDTELENKVSAGGRANLKTSVWMACRPRDIDAGEAFLDDVLREMKPVIRERLLDFWARGIRGADFFISAIGPALSVFGRHPRVLKPSGEEVSVREFLDIVRRESTEVALEQVLGGSDLGLLDPVTRLYVTWAWSFSKSPLDAGDVIALGLASGADYGVVTRPGSIAAESREKSKKMVKLKTIADRGRNEETLGLVTAGRAPALVDQLHRAAFLWSRNQAGALADYREELGETRWHALRVLGQAVAECLPDGDEDRRLVNGLLGSAAGATAAPARAVKPTREGTQLKLGG